MSSREIADEINRRGVYARGDGSPLTARQVAARVRRSTYRERYEIDSKHRIRPAAASEDEEETTSRIRGPHGWINWYAQRIGQPRREQTHPESVVIRPTWDEFVLYTDAPIEGTWPTLGPYELQGLEPPTPPRLGVARRALLLRSWDHLSDKPSRAAPTVTTDIEDYYGGDIGDELAALLGLALGRRVRSGGPVRKGMPGAAHPLGLAWEAEHHPPVLEPPRRGAMIDWVADPASLEDAVPLLASYPELDAPDAIALVRAARQFVDGLWLADLDPRLAWIKLIGALEVAANRVDDTREETALDQLRRHRPKLHRVLKDAPVEVAEAVAGQTARMYDVERKLRSFVRRFDPGPPQVRPAEEGSRFEWRGLDEALGVIYDHRSRDLHDGIAFPWVLCEPPMPFRPGVPAERFIALGVSGQGGQWSAEDLPMYLHVFAYIAGGALRRWWAQCSRSE
jgi:hypothetical protein